MSAYIKKLMRELSRPSPTEEDASAPTSPFFPSGGSAYVQKLERERLAALS